MNSLRYALVFLFVFILAFSGARRLSAADLASEFQTPSDTVKPWCYWWWVKGNVTPESITRDLEQMKQKGFAGLLMFDARGYHEDHLPPPPARMEFMSPEWRRMLKFAMAEASRLGLEVSVNLSSCAGALRGPWPVGDDAPKKLLWASTEIQGGKAVTCQLPGDDWGQVWEVAVVAARHGGNDPKSPVVEVVDLSGKTSEGRLAWDAPPGRWTLVRFACITEQGHENDVDILDAKAVEKYFRRMGHALLEDAGPLAGKTLTHLYSVSWEGAAPTWTLTFEKEFQDRRGYSLRPWLPVLAGLTVNSAEVSQRFLRDYHVTLSDCFRDNCYGTLRELCHQAGLKWHSESGGPWNRKLPSFEHADQLAFLGRNDMPQGEFWYPYRGLNRPPAMAAHIYGRPLAATEAFTHMRPHWSVYPALLKPCADAAFCEGVNHFIWHTFTASPPEFGKPGIEYFAGSHLNPNVTWWEQAGPFLTYLARCQAMLRHGQPVADVCCYTGDSPYLHWGRGEKWCEKPSLVLGKGYTYDLLNTEVLLSRISVKDGRVVLPEGLSYRMLVLDLENDIAPPEALRKIVELAQAGATVVLGERRPQRTPGLAGFPACDDEVQRLADQLWEAGEAKPGVRQIGKGKIYAGMKLDDVLKSEKILTDFDGPWDYTHRSSAETDVYFVVGSGEAECLFRVRDRLAELWDPVSGRTSSVASQEHEDGRTAVSLSLPQNGSVFVVFRSAAEGRRLPVAAPAGEAQPAETQTLTGPWEVRFAPGWGAPESVVFESLRPWNEHANEGVKFFSGTATYRKSFDLSETQAKSPIQLDLGEIKYIADVRVNGKPLGVVWTAPWSVDLTGIVQPGKNLLEIDVTNLWVNRLIGDAQLPEEKRFTKTHARRTAADQGPHAHLRGYKADDPLLPSGLLGPVRLEFRGR